MEKEFLENQLDDINEALEISGEESYTQDIITLYLKEISKYPVLTDEEVKKYCTDLKLYSKISDLISKRTINNHVEPVLDIDIVLASIKTEEERKYITNILSDYCYNYGRKESESDKVVMYYLQEYNKLYKSLSHIPTPEELTTYFSKPNKYNLFTDFTNITKLESKDLMLKVSNYVKYMIAKNTMINCNLRLVIGVAKKYSTTDSMELLDRINEGNQGLITAVEKFKVDKGCKFSTYAMWWIKQKIKREITNNDKMIRIPINTNDKKNNYFSECYQLEQEYQRSLTQKEISEKLNIPLSEIKKYDRIKILSESTSLETPVGDKKDTLLLELIPNEFNTEDMAMQINLKEELEEALSCLTLREKEIIELRFGLKDGIAHTLEETGRKYNVTRERIRQLELSALTKLRNPRRSRKLKDFLEKNN